MGWKSLNAPLLWAPLCGANKSNNNAVISGTSLWRSLAGSTSTGLIRASLVFVRWKSLFFLFRGKQSYRMVHLTFSPGFILTNFSGSFSWCRLLFLLLSVLLVSVIIPKFVLSWMIWDGLGQLGALDELGEFGWVGWAQFTRSSFGANFQVFSSNRLGGYPLPLNDRKFSSKKSLVPGKNLNV